MKFVARVWAECFGKVKAHLVASTHRADGLHVHGALGAEIERNGEGDKSEETA